MQEVIIYRNPFEAAIWHSLMNGGFIVVLAFLVAALIGVGVYVQIEKLHERAYKTWRFDGTSYKTVAFFYLHVGKISIAAGLLSLYVMHLANIKGWI